MNIQQVENNEKRSESVGIIKNFSQNLVLIRKHKGVTQATFAEMLGVNRSYLCAVEKGYRNPSIKLVCSISIMTDIPIKQLLTTLTDHPLLCEIDALDKLNKDFANVQSIQKEWNKIAFALKEIRQRRHISQSKVSEIVHMSRSYLSLIERGNIIITLEMLDQLLEFYDCKLEDII